MRGLIPVSCVAGVILVAACSERSERACQADADCPQGSLCRDGVCVSSSSDAGAQRPVDAGFSTCSSDGLLCSTFLECCSGSCTDGRCGPTAPATGTGTPTCRNVYELCQDDCCAGLKCVAGSCR